MSYLVLFCSLFFSPFSIAITSLGEERELISAFRTFVRFVLVWFCRFPPRLDVWEGPQFVVVALPGLFSYLFCSCLLQEYFPVLSRKIFCCVWWVLFGKAPVNRLIAPINRLIDYLIDKYHKNEYSYRLADNRSFYFCVCYFSVFTPSILTPYHTSSKIWILRSTLKGKREPKSFLLEWRGYKRI